MLLASSFFRPGLFFGLNECLEVELGGPLALEWITGARNECFGSLFKSRFLRTGAVLYGNPANLVDTAIKAIFVRFTTMGS